MAKAKAIEHLNDREAFQNRLRTHPFVNDLDFSGAEVTFDFSEV
jgi:hypothetical protein